jgi:hypothetical protein
MLTLLMLGQTMALKRLEPCAGKLACTVLRRAVVGNDYRLSDSNGLYTSFICDIGKHAFEGIPYGIYQIGKRLEVLI